MTKTNALRKLIFNSLSSVCEKVYYLQANEQSMYPHIVFRLSSVDLGDLSRDDYILDVDIWDKSMSSLNIIEMADRCEELLKTQNLPQTDILPTIFTNNRVEVIDDVKDIKHITLEFVVQLYER